MPNGFHGKKEEWDRMEAPLLEIDGVLADFAEKHGCQYSRNFHNNPERSISWGKKIEKLIQIYLDDEDKLTFNLWIAATQDRWGKRYWKKEFLRKGVPISDIKQNLPALLHRSYEILESWKNKDLELAVKLWKL